ncbi:hypothetical protein IFR05_012162, partial [Cadophora sp. M221]
MEPSATQSSGSFSASSSSASTFPGSIESLSSTLTIPSILSSSWPQVSTFNNTSLDFSTLAIISLTTFRTLNTTTATLPFPTHTHCAADNCLRAFRRHSGQEFCSIFTLDGTTAPALPTFATQCTGATLDRVSSACTCLNNGISQTPTFTFTGFESETSEVVVSTETG